MARNTGPRARRGRRLGIGLSEISGKPEDKDPWVRRPYPPGQHGPDSRLKLSEYAVRLQEKQKLKLHYELLETACRRYFTIAKRSQGATGPRMLQLLERRLDAVVFRAGFASSIRQARQFVRHGHVKVGGERIDIPSFSVKTGSEVALDPEFRKGVVAEEAIARASRRAVPPYLESDVKVGSVKVLRSAEVEELPFRLEMHLIVEFYAQRV